MEMWVISFFILLKLFRDPRRHVKLDIQSAYSFIEGTLHTFFHSFSYLLRQRGRRRCLSRCKSFGLEFQFFSVNGSMATPLCSLGC